MTQPTEYQEHPAQPARLPAETPQQEPQGQSASTPITPPSQIIAQRPVGKTDTQLLAEAQAAVRAGANPAAVEAQLKTWGVSADGR